MAKNKSRKPKTVFGKIWYFVWDDNSIWSWIVNIILAFILIKFIVYPVLGLLLTTSHPIVAVVSSSMEHNDQSFDEWWIKSNSNPSNYWNYEDNNIQKDEFREFIFKNGFNKGDIIFLKGAKAEDLKVGEVIVFNSDKPYPVIHRIVKREYENGQYLLTTKGDNDVSNRNADRIKIHDELIIGKALFRIPGLGYVKIGAGNIFNWITGKNKK
ncbi:MAG: signal peptidase I [bacterium]|nr:signal peptidase I [bacterium]